ncbi:MAG: polysaccharide deacetylase family protein [Vallitalea sp.]|jgi:peptidoglycan/xylan/chitin deacetylase (PgdA/CDA1 family)|nr:polysaccharide deacetylase family protein [Vallitalea sp.]
MREILRSLFLTFNGHFKSLSNDVHIINSHFFSDNIPYSINRFESQLKYLSDKVVFCSLDEAVSLIENKVIVDKPYITFTYDDGFCECYEHIVPVLDKYEIKAAFFINPNFIDGDSNYQSSFMDKVCVSNKKPMTWGQLKELSNNGHIIGAHTMDHVDLGQSFSIEELEYQLGECKRVIEQKVGNECNHFAYPFGQLQHLNEKSLSCAQNHFKYIYSGTNFKSYSSFHGSVINRRHIEPFWPISHMKYFLSFNKVFR